MLRYVRSICAAVALLASAASAFGQSSILQGGAWVPGRSPMYVGQGQSQPIVQDSGSAGGGGIGLGLAEQLLSVRSPTNTYPAANAGSGPLGTNWCDYDAPITNATGYHYLCLGPNSNGGGIITYGSGGGASVLPFSFNINGASYQFPFSVGGIVGPGSTTVNDFVLWNNTTGTLVKDGGAQIGTSQIANNAVTSAQIAAGAVGNSQLASNAVGTSNIQSGAVGTTQIANNAVTATQIAAGAVGTTQIASGAVGTTQIANNAVTSAQIAAGAVAQSDLAADATFWRTATGTDTILNTDCWKTVALGGNALFSETLPAVTGFPAGCRVWIKNTDVYTGTATGRGKQLVGFPVDATPYSANPILYPDETIAVQIVNGAWVSIQQTGRWFLPTTAELCVRQDGSATADGLGNGATASDCLPLQQSAVNTIGQRWDGTGYKACNIGLYAGGTSTFAEQVSMTGQSVGCYIQFFYRGVVTHTSTSNCFTGGDNGIAIWNMNLGFVPTFKCNSSNTATNAVWYCHQTCIYDVFGIFLWVPGGTNDSMMFLDGQGRVTASFTVGGSGSISVGDGTTRSFNNMFHCDQHCAQLQVSGSIAFSANVSGTRIFAAYEGSAINTSTAFVGSPTIISASLSSGGSALNTNGSTIPGGTPSAGGPSASAPNITGGIGIVCTSKC